MIKRFRDALSIGLDDEVVDSAVRQGMHDMLTALDNVVDDEAVLDQIYAGLGKARPSHPDRRHESSSAADEVCSRISMLESVIAAAVKSAQPSYAGTASLAQARRFLFELRTGLERRTMTAEDAFRLLNVIGHALNEACRILRRQETTSPKKSIQAQVSDLRKLAEDVRGTFSEIEEQVMRLFGHSNDSSPVLVPQP